LLASGRPHALGDGPQFGRSGMVGPPMVVLGVGFGVDLACDGVADGAADADGVADAEDVVVGVADPDGCVADPYVPVDASALGFPT